MGPAVAEVPERHRLPATLMVGDTPYDVEAARAAGVDTIALRCGGWWDDAALSGAVALYDHPAALVRAWRAAPIYRRRIPGG